MKSSVGVARNVSPCPLHRSRTYVVSARDALDAKNIIMCRIKSRMAVLDATPAEAMINPAKQRAEEKIAELRRRGIKVSKSDIRAIHAEARRNWPMPAKFEMIPPRAVACMKLSRRIVGCDVDAAQVEKAQARAALARVEPK